jgi:hypothetical protein
LGIKGLGIFEILSFERLAFAKYFTEIQGFRNGACFLGDFERLAPPYLPLLLLPFAKNNQTARLALWTCTCCMCPCTLSASCDIFGEKYQKL